MGPEEEKDYRDDGRAEGRGFGDAEARRLTRNPCAHNMCA